MKKPFLRILFLLLLGFGAYYFYQNIIYKQARDIDKETPAFLISATGLVKDYKANIVKADSKYLNKTIKIEGNVTEITDSTLVLDHTVFCKTNQTVPKNLLNKKISIKGRCIGYDDLFEIIKLDQCSKQ